MGIISERTAAPKVKYPNPMYATAAPSIPHLTISPNASTPSKFICIGVIARVSAATQAQPAKLENMLPF